MQDQIEFAPQWKAVLGVRYDYYDTRTQQTALSSLGVNTGPFERTDNLWSGRAGLINPDFDRMFLDASDHDPEKLAVLTREEYVREAGSEGIELITWLVMRGALGPRIRRVYEAYHVPASNAAAGMVLYEILSR